MDSLKCDSKHIKRVIIRKDKVNTTPRMTHVYGSAFTP